MCLIYVKVGGFRELLVWIGWGIFFCLWGEVAILPHIFGGTVVILYIRIGLITLKKRTFLIGISWRLYGC